MADGGDLLRRWEDGEINALQFVDEAAEALVSLREQLADAQAEVAVWYESSQTLQSELEQTRTALTEIVRWWNADSYAQVDRFEHLNAAITAAAALSEEPTNG